jgi:hypothetical protein
LYDMVSEVGVKSTWLLLKLHCEDGGTANMVVQKCFDVDK